MNGIQVFTNRKAPPVVQSIAAGTKRLIPAFNQTLVEGSVINHTAAANYGAKHSLQSTAAAAYSAVVLAHSITGLKVNMGEAGPNGVDYASPLEIPNVTSYLVVGVSNQGAFTNLRGGTDQPLDAGLQFSTRKAYSGSAGDTIKILTGLIRASGSTKNGECNPCRLGNQFANCSSDVVALSADMTTFLTGTSIVAGASGSYPGFVFLETTSETNAWIIEGNSLDYGGTGWWSIAVQDATRLSRDYDGACSTMQWALTRPGASSNAIPWFGMAESGATIFHQYRQTVLNNLGGGGTNYYDPQRFQLRAGIRKSIQASNRSYGLGINERAAASSGFVLADYIAALEQCVRQVIQEDQLYGRRTWFRLDPLQTSWTGGGTVGDLTLSESAFRDAQTPTYNTLIAGGADAILDAERAMLDRVCRQEGAWWIDCARLWQTKNTRGETVWNKTPDGVGGWLAPTGTTASATNDWTHAAHKNCVNAGATISALLPNKTQTSGFRAFGCLNPA